ncbi:ATP-dependent DNA ligase [Pseudonocardia nigra]|uniref:ATP-dependent DNA ligase n=1 Tax=Pseudonocardia nigra TaxID=1921578 RepID=UPI001C5E9259|nr:histidine kinase [Pseudonocardia nigra]
MTGRATASGLPDLVPPMLPAAGSGDPPTGADWVVEVAWTGHRCIAYVQPGRRVRLLSGAANSMSAAYPELAEPLLRRCPPGGMVLDGTLVARGEEHAVRPRLLKRRSGLHRPSDDTIRRIPVDFQVADLLWLDGHSAMDLPYADRRTLLDGLGFASPPVWTTSPLPASELDALLDIAEQKGADGLHARHLRARYRPGGRSRFWLRLPLKRTRQVLVGGWTAAQRQGSRATVGTLLLGAPVDGRLHYVGRVGVSLEEGRLLAAELAGREPAAPPFGDGVPADAARDAHWVEPDLAGLVEFTGWIGGGRMRRPHWRGALEPGAVRADRWAHPPAPAPVVEPPAQPAVAEPPAVEARRLEQHFVYNTLNTIASLIRTDPSRARELLIGFADLSRAADQAGTSTLGRELAAVADYLRLEQARFGARLQVVVDVEPALHPTPVAPLQVLAVVREAVQRGIEPRPDGGLLTVRARSVAGGCVVEVTAGEERPTEIPLPAATGSSAR